VLALGVDIERDAGDKVAGGIVYVHELQKGETKLPGLVWVPEEAERADQAKSSDSRYA